MQVMSMATQLRVADLERAVRFYVDVLGFEEGFRFQDFYAEVRGGGSALHLKRVERADPSIAFVREGDHLHLHLRVADLDAAFRQISAVVAGIEPITTKPWGDREFTVHDPDGHTLYLAPAELAPISDP